MVVDVIKLRLGYPNVKLKVWRLQRLFLRHKFINPGEITMETVFCSSFLDTVAATHDKNRFQSDFCCLSFLS